jgi:uncharacterized repeat protein (TIGR04138 family)
VKKAIEDVVKELGRYPLEAFDFLHRGLDYTVRKAHGPLVPEMGRLLQWLEAQEADPSELRRLTRKGVIPSVVMEFIESLGGLDAALERLNRHVDGEELCWGLRDLALKQWGLMAVAVLRLWGIRSTKDFGRMVFALVENDLLQKQPEDRLEDFEAIYDFDKELEASYKIEVPGEPTRKPDQE